jgi:hypothetical protein
VVFFILNEVAFSAIQNFLLYCISITLLYSKGVYSYFSFMPALSQSEDSNLTIDKVIEKFIPIIGAIFLVVWMGYLLYTSVWLNMGFELKLGLWFFLSVVIIWSAFSFSDKLRYFADVVMGGWILLLYATLIYGSRTTELATAVFPEVATLVTAFFFTLAIAYFSSLRKSKVILALWMLGAYLTPFFIWQNDTWVQNISFNAYLVYFTAVNIVVFFLGKEVAVQDLVPLNILGLFFGTSVLYHLSYYENIQAVGGSFFTGEYFSAVLFVILTIFAIVSLAYSSRYFLQKNEPYITVGYLLPLFWFFINIERLPDLDNIFVTGLYILLIIAYFAAWYSIRELPSTRYQHLALYTGWTISAVLAVIALFPEFNTYAAILIAYVGLVFGVLYYFVPTKGERLLIHILLTLFGAFFAFQKIYFFPDDVALSMNQTMLAVISLIPAILTFPIAKSTDRTPKDMVHLSKMYSIIALTIAVFLTIGELLDNLDVLFVFFVLPWFIMVLMSLIQNKSPSRGTLLRIWSILVWIGVIPSFLFFVANLAPGVANNEHFWVDGGIFTNWHFIKGFFATVAFFIGLWVSRELQKIEKIDRPSFLLVISGYSLLLLMVNFALITFLNDMWAALTTGWVRAVGTTIWWITLSITMIIIGVRGGSFYRSEKLLGLMLLFLTIWKIGFYDLASMDTDKKVIVLMASGVLLMAFSYFLQVKWYLKNQD